MGASTFYLELIRACEAASGPDGHLGSKIAEILGANPLLDCTGSFDDALKMLPPGADWRKLTHPSISVYAANPYNANAQKRHDGNGATPPLQMCAALLRLAVEPILKAEATAARKTQSLSKREAANG